MSEGPQDLAADWHSTVAAIRDSGELGDRQMAFVELSRLVGFLGDTALIAVPDQLTKDVLEQRVSRTLENALGVVCGRRVGMAVTIDPALAAEPIEDEQAESDPPAPSSTADEQSPEERRRQIWAVPSPSPAIVDNGVDNAGVSAYDATRLNEKYTFDTFVIGASNRFACAAASAVAETPAKAYNPLFIYGDSGLGKTHLLHAVGHYSRQLYPGLRVRYVNSEEFTNDFINSISSGQFGRQEQFQQRYRDVDILMIDDIQFLQHAPETMEAFFHTFNTLYNGNKQIVITSDLPPKQLSGFEERMRSRFEMGLLTDIQPPDLETRIAILRRKVSYEQWQVPFDVLELIASRISTNIRELEGALNRIVAYQSLSSEPMDRELAEFVMKDLVSDDEQEITPADIMAATADFFGLSVEDLTGSARTRQLTTARQIAMYLCREMTDMPLMKIGQAFGGRDHTTVIHAYKKISELMKERQQIFNQVGDLTKRLKNQRVR